MNKIEYYKSNEVLTNKYYQIPQELFTSTLYKDKLTSDSKILYAFLLDRLTLSQKNHWIDENNYVFLIFTRHEVQDKLGLSEKTVIKAFKQLVDVNLISEKRQGLGKPNLIYVGKIIHEEITKQENVQLKNCKKYSSKIENNTTLDKENLHTINTNNNKNELINIDTINPNSSNDTQLEKIKNKCKLEEFTKDKKTILEDVINTLYHKDTLKIGNVTVNHLKIIEKLQLIVKENLIQLLEILKNTPNIQNAKNYLMICLYNNLGNNNIYKMTQKNTLSDNENCEQFYDDWKFLYANPQG